METIYPQLDEVLAAYQPLLDRINRDIAAARQRMLACKDDWQFAALQREVAPLYDHRQRVINEVGRLAGLTVPRYIFVPSRPAAIRDGEGGEGE